MTSKPFHVLRHVSLLVVVMISGKRKSNNKKAVAQVIGGIIFILTAVVFFSFLGVIIAHQSSVSSANLQAQNLLGERVMENLDAYMWPSGKITVFNNGSLTSQIIDVLVVNATTGGIVSLEPVSLRPLSLLGNATIPFNVPPSSEIGILTSLGNVFWVQDSPPPGTPTPSFNITIG